MDRIYCDLMLLASGVISVLAVTLLTMKIPHRRELEKLKKARATLVASFITLSVLNFVCYFTGYDKDLDRLNTLIVASYQALLLTGTLLVFIRPDVVTTKWVVSQVVIITGLAAVLYAFMLLLPKIYGTLFYIGAALLVLQLVLYSFQFFRSLKVTLEDANAYYAEDCSPRLDGIRAGFILMLAIGMMAFSTLFAGPWFYIVFVPAYLVCYTIVAICMLRYVNTTAFILPAISGNTAEKMSNSNAKAHIELSESQERELKHNVSQWVAERKYRERDIPYSGILAALGTDASTMRAFMKNEYGMDFRTWRNRLRLQDACELLSAQPELNAERISETVGYSDSSNFHTDFKKFTGKSVSEYKKCLEKDGQLRGTAD